MPPADIFQRDDAHVERGVLRQSAAKAGEDVGVLLLQVAAHPGIDQFAVVLAPDLDVRERRLLGLEIDGDGVHEWLHLESVNEAEVGIGHRLRQRVLLSCHGRPGRFPQRYSAGARRR